MSPRRIVAMQAWYEGGRVYKKRFANARQLIEFWKSLPDDGALIFRYWYNRKKPVRLGASMSGCPWYFLLAQDDPALDGAFKKEEIDRYPNAIIKRGKLVGVAEMERVVAEAAAAKYWGD